MQKILSKGKYMDEFNGIHIDYTNNKDLNTGLFLTNDSKIKSDVLGNVTRQANFAVYRNVFNANDKERIENSSFILDLANYLEDLSFEGIELDIKVGDEMYKSVITSIQCSNGMMFQYLNGNPTLGSQYMLQVQVTYQIQSGICI